MNCRFKLMAVLVVATTATVGCTFEPGQPWGYLEADLYVDPVADSGDFTITHQRVFLEEMHLRAPAQSAGGITDFDPSDPPPGFTLCHQNHCHHEDGYTVSYDDLRAGVGVDADGPVNVARHTLDTAHTLDRTAQQEVDFRLVDQVTVNETALTVGELYLEGQLEYGEQTHIFEITLAMATQSLQTGISYTFGRNSPEHQQAELLLQWPDDLFVDLTHLDEALDGATGAPIAVHGTQNSLLRDELIERIQRDAELVWLEDYDE